MMKHAEQQDLVWPNGNPNMYGSGSQNNFNSQFAGGQVGSFINPQNLQVENYILKDKLEKIEKRETAI